MSKFKNKEKVLSALKNKSFVKIISGIQNYDKQKTLSVAMSGELGGASALDISDKAEIIETVRASVQLPLFVSSLDPSKLIAAQELGADVLEIGNYESFYKEGRMFTPKEIIDIVQKVKNSLAEDILLCCTIPATLEIENQVKLAKKVVSLGVDIIQTEGFAIQSQPSERKDQSYNELLKAASTLTNTIEIRKALPNVNIITASGITLTTTPLAIAMGASGVGIGNYINSLTSQVEMTEKVEEIVDSINNFISKPIEKFKIAALKV